MPANHKVSVAWQIVATFVIIANFWAFYRIRKLRKYLLYVYVPSIIISTAVAAYVSSTGLWVASSGGEPVYEPFVLPPAFYAIYAISAGLQALAIYLAIIWSREHNRKFDQPVNRKDSPP